MLESWFIAVKHPYNRMILLWKNTFINILKESCIDGVSKINKSKLWLETNKEFIPFFSREYLAIHVANLWCIQNNKEYKDYYNRNIYLYNATKTALVSLNSRKSLIYGIGVEHNFPIIKFTHIEIKY